MNGSISLMDGVSSSGVEGLAGLDGGVRAVGLEGVANFDGDGEAAVGSCVDSRASGDAPSTCCVVLLKYLARIGRRNVGGRAEVDDGASSATRRTARENILTELSS